MWKFIVRRVFLAIVIVVLGSFIIYGVMRAMPTSFVEAMARQRAAASATTGGPTYQEWLEQLNESYEMNTNIFTGFVRWLGRVIHGDFGDSWKYGVPVIQKFQEVIWHSVALNFVTIILEVLICIPLGIKAARHQYSGFDYGITVFAMLCISLPTFFLATLLKFGFAVKLGWFDLYGMVGRFHEQLSQGGKILDIIHHMFLPVLTLAMLNIGGLTRYTRTNMLEVLNADYIRTARAKGLPEKTVINRHAFRNTLIPLVSYMSYLIPSLFSGSMITETLYQIPGIGYIAYDAMVAGDLPFTMFYSVFGLILTQISLMLADIMYAVVDPRVRVN
ncbi:ABC transporter permease [Aristaeella lactis]|uniref:Peptide/nickel transport system permease protein n=1 Tax=Aristaeella lactis TaxID=3046383 RepID=A0AC61PN12_9FIRM|nr:ABC transporter permease [Aristaeella lactis]QUA52787.1 ABC transporter permease [Aristaeella lactis]SMC73431.1 peptide/nickel transport system permease protein [Aristaeella lactis]